MFREILMIADFLGINSKITFYENDLVGIRVDVSEKSKGEQTYSHKFVNIPLFQFVVRR
jgi:hypothetical protein